MTGLRAELAAIVGRLAASGEVTLDALGEAIGAMLISSEEIDLMISTLEARGVRVVGPEGGGGEAHLRVVVTTARALVAELGRRPTSAEIAARSGLALDDVRHALALARVMQR